MFCCRDPLLDDSPLRSEFVVKEEKEKEKKPKGEYTVKHQKYVKSWCLDFIL